MKKILLTFLVFCISLCVFSENTGYETQIKRVQNAVSRLDNSLNALKKDNSTLKLEVSMLSQQLKQQTKLTDSLKVQVLENKASADNSAKDLNKKLVTTDNKTTELTKNIGSKTMIGMIIAISLCVILVIVYTLLHKRINKSNEDIASMQGKADELSAKADEINSKIVEHFNNEVSELQKLATSAAALSKTSGQSGNNDEQDLIKTLADRITFMEMTLFRMDKKVRGYKQLTKSISQMKDNLKANGYEIVDMLGKPYNQGMKVTANFIEDESLDQGQQLITGIIKPQINYKGKMIQAAQITVSQNV